MVPRGLRPARRPIHGLRGLVRPGDAPVAAHAGPNCLGRPGPASGMDRDRVRAHGGCQPCAPGPGRLGLVHRLAVRLRRDRRGGGAPFGDDPCPARRPRPGSGGRLRGRRRGRSVVRRLREGRWRLLTLLVVLTGGCDLPGKPREADRPVPAEQVTGFDTLYAARCAGCHGADGKLGPAPPLNDPLFLAIVPDDELLRVIREGRALAPGKKTPMPAFSLGQRAPLSPAQAEAWARLEEEAHAAPRQQGPLTPAQVRVLADGIKKRWGPSASPPASVPPYLAAAGTNSGKK